jgi:hypothetical protein
MYGGASWALSPERASANMKMGKNLTFLPVCWDTRRAGTPSTLSIIIKSRTTEEREDSRNRYVVL